MEPPVKLLVLVIVLVNGGVIFLEPEFLNVLIQNIVAKIAALTLVILGGNLVLDDEESPSKLMVSHRGSGTLSSLDLDIDDTGKLNLSCGDSSNSAGLTTTESVTDCDKDHIYLLVDAMNMLISNLEYTRQ